MKTEKFIVTGMTCAACQANVEKTVKKLDGVIEAEVNLLTGHMSVSFEEQRVSMDDIVKSITSIGYGVELKKENASSQKSDLNTEWQKRKKASSDEQKSMKSRLVVSVVLLVPLMYVAMGHMLNLPMPSFLSGEQNAAINAFTQFLITLPILAVNRKFFQSGFKSLIKRVPNMDSLVAIGSGASLLYGVFAIYRMIYGFSVGDISIVSQYSHSLYFESSAMILTLVTVGKYLEAKSKSKTTSTLENLAALAPKTATVVRLDKEITIPCEQIVTGDVIIIKPGESIPVDGIITQGNGYVDQSAITGESIPVEKNIGDQVISATINKNGSFRFKASKVGEETTLSQIIKMVDQASSSKAPISRLADRISGIFVPIVILISVITAIVWLILGKDFEFALTCAVSVLVISCPCALGLATPVAIMVGTGKAAELGILIKSAQSLENLHSINTVVLDKTGTITSGKPTVTDIIVIDKNTSEKELLSMAACVEAGSEHPLAQAVIQKAKEEQIVIQTPSSFEAVAGRGITASLNGGSILGGNFAFMKEKEILNIDKAESLSQNIALEGKTPLFFAKDGYIIGIIAVADTIREASRSAINEFQKMGLEVVMLTGDNRLSAQAIGKKLNINNIISDVLPSAKEACIRDLQEKGKKVAMIGDGINDAPALTRADIGIAIGAGTDVAIDCADIVLIKNSLSDAVSAIKLSKAVIKNIRMNLFWAFFYNVLGIPVAAGLLYPAFGLLLSPMLGSLAMSLSSLFVVTNALRLRLFKENKQLSHDKKMIEKGELRMTKTLKIEGMMCAHCKAHVEKALADVDGVAKVEVSLEEKSATLELSKNVDDSVLSKAVADAGYSVV